MKSRFKKLCIVNYSYEEAMNRCSSVLPGDLIVEILHRLPAKSLLRFESISKPWKSLICSSEFIAKHYKRAKKKAEEVNYLHLYNYPGCRNDCLSFLLCNCSEKISGPRISIAQGISLISKRDDGNIITSDICHAPCLAAFQRLSIVGSSNGLVCIRFCSFTRKSRNFFGWDRVFSIWNPATRKFKLLLRPQPSPALQCDHLSNTIVGFSYIHSTCSYKLVQILVYKSFDKGNIRFSSRVEVFNLGANSWREVVCPGQDEVILELCWQICQRELSKAYIHNRPLVVKSCLHWTGNLQNGELILVSFDLDKEVFSKTALPDNYGIKLAVFEDNLAAFIFSQASSDENEDHFEVWIYEGTSQSWTKQFSFGPLPRGDYPVGFWENGEIIIKKSNLSYSFGPETYLYNPKIKEKKNFFCNDQNCNLAFEPYVESLVNF